MPEKSAKAKVTNIIKKQPKKCLETNYSDKIASKKITPKRRNRNGRIAKCPNCEIADCRQPELKCSINEYLK